MNALLIIAICQVPLTPYQVVPTAPVFAPQVVGRPSVADVSSPQIELWTTNGATYQRAYRSNEPWKPYNRAGGGSQTSPTLPPAVRPGLTVSPQRSVYSPFPAAMWGGRTYTGRVCSNGNCRM